MAESPNNPIVMDNLLLVLVHGLGSSNAFWGPAINLLQEKASSSEHRLLIRPWQYLTNKRPKLRGGNLYRFTFGKPLEQNLEQLGQHLWDDLEQQCQTYDRIRIFAHSMGGLVVASALGLNSSKYYDSPLYAKLESIAFCASPLAGTRRARQVHALFIIWTQRTHSRS